MLDVKILSSEELQLAVGFCYQRVKEKRFLLKIMIQQKLSL